MLPRPLLIAIAFAVLLSGCADPVQEVQEAPGIEELQLEATETTGVIRGVVVDDAIRPLAGATVRLPTEAGERSVNTTQDGLFGFDGLQPGTYFLTVSRVGYATVQQSADVVAGDDEPPIVKVLLARDASFQPFYSVFVHDGFIECTTSFLVLCGLPNLVTGDNITNDRFTWTWFFEGNSSHIQAEMVWDSTQPLSPNLYFEMEPSGDCDEGFFNRTEGPSPIYATLNQTQVEEGPIDLECGIYFSLFSGHNPPLPRQPGTGWGIGATLQQRFQMYAHVFYDFLPPPGWRFTEHGEPQVPQA